MLRATRNTNPMSAGTIFCTAGLRVVTSDPAAAPAESPTSSEKGRTKAKFGTRGFTLVEVLIALSVLALSASTAFFALNRMNQISFANRLYSEAQAVAENQVDILLTRGPFDPTRTPPLVPPELQVGTTTQSGVLIYVDPVTNQTVVTGTMMTTITDPGLTQTIITGGTTTTANLNLRQIKVAVNYNYRSTNYNVVMNSMRTADQ
jgi:prepilin-type N-terminal cleavage/methylation domain-containing protein